MGEGEGAGQLWSQHFIDFIKSSFIFTCTSFIDPCLGLDWHGISTLLTEPASVWMVVIPVDYLMICTSSTGAAEDISTQNV